jgi:hypothetical protein
MLGFSLRMFSSLAADSQTLCTALIDENRSQAARDSMRGNGWLQDKAAV